MENISKKLDLKMAAAGFFLPMVGIVLYLVWKEEKPLEATSAFKGALASIALGVAAYAIFFIFSAMLGTLLFF